MSGNEGAGCRVLVVEDDMLIAVAIEEVVDREVGRVCDAGAVG
jgi:hypothetical protein